MKLLLCLSVSLALGAEQMIRVPEGNLEITDQITTLKVRVSVSAFLLGAAEVSGREYREVVGSNPSFYQAAERPVENVSWWDAIRYTNLLSAREGLTPCYDLATGERQAGCNGFRLPTDAEWIRAAGDKPAAGLLEKMAALGRTDTGNLALFEPLLRRGTLPVRSLAPDAAGFHDLWGNVWEWCEDWADPVQSPDAVRDPRGPLHGMMRVIHGGSFVTTTGGWSRQYRSSMKPEDRSRFTGFRVARSLPASGAPAATADATWFARFDQAPAGFETSTGPLQRLAGSGGGEAWNRRANELRSKWIALLSPPAVATSSPVNARFVKEVYPRNFTGRIHEVETEPGIWEKVCVLRPRNPSGRPLPVVIVPFYDIDVPVGADFGGRSFTAAGVNSFAYTAAQRGYLAVAVRWYGESDGEWYSEASANLLLRHPGSTGLGKWVSDSRRILDFIQTLPDADSARIGMFGHSLGGKMTLYAAAFDERIRAAVCSELGIAFKSSNYEDYWYLGERLQQAPAGTDQHELIGLMAPRPFLLIGGDQFDGKESWHYINAARDVYKMYGKPQNVGMFNHHAGHTPTQEAVQAAFDWLDRFLK